MPEASQVFTSATLSLSPAINHAAEDTAFGRGALAQLCSPQSPATHLLPLLSPCDKLAYPPGVHAQCALPVSSSR